MDASPFVSGGRLVTARQAALYISNPFMIWAEKFADSSLKDEESAYQRLLFEKGNEHEENVVADAFPDASSVEYSSLEEGFGIVLQWMKEGVDAIHGAPLFFDGLYGEADILEKRSGKSDLGDHHYIVKEIKLAKNIKEKHILQAAFYTYVLGKVQGFIPSSFVLINYDGEEFSYSFSKYESKLMKCVEGAKKIALGEEEPRPVYDSDYPWSSLSKKMAEERQDVTLLPSLGYSMQKKLNEAGVYTLDDLRQADADAILAIKGVGRGTYEKWVRHLEAFEKGEAIMLKKPVLPSVSKEVYFDIEGDTELDMDYLYGCLVKEDGGEKFHYFWADSPEDEEQLWKDFCVYIDGLVEDDFVLYYYTSYEKRSLKRMKERYGCSEELYKKIVDHMVDLFPILTKSFVLPLHSYSIKPVAKWLGFSWRASDAGGDNSMEWYARFLEGEREMKQKILDYNEDDVRATLVLKEWMEKF